MSIVGLQGRLRVDGIWHANMLLPVAEPLRAYDVESEAWLVRSLADLVGSRRHEFALGFQGLLAYQLVLCLDIVLRAKCEVSQLLKIVPKAQLPVI